MPTLTDLDRTLEDGRAEFESLLTDTCRITRAAEETPAEKRARFNETTKKYEDPPPRVTIYEGPCRVQVKVDVNSNVVETTAGEREWTYLTAHLQLPVDHPAGASGDVNAIEVDDVCEILTAPYSPTLVGAQLNIQSTYHKSHAVYTRYRVREVIQ